MFGLMRAKTCGMSAVEKRFRRLNYCGTCKTLGSLYGQKTRFLLNFDTVFLSELLTALSLEAKDFSRAYQSYDCLTLPKNESEMPLALQLAATANVVLTEFKLADKIVDEKSRVAKFANKAFSKSFRQAEKRLRDWDFPFDEVRNLLETQSQREAAAGDLEELSLPTAFATANFFSHGARLIGRENEQVNLEKIGYAFGKLIYLLDAFEDFGKDFRRQEFNAIRATYNLNKEKLPANIKRKVVSNLLALQEEIIFNLHELPIADSQKEIFALRLRQNLDRKLKIELPVLQTSKVCRTKPVTFKTRLTNAKIFAKKLTAQSFSA